MHWFGVSRAGKPAICTLAGRPSLLKKVLLKKCYSIGVETTILTASLVLLSIKLIPLKSF